MSIEYEYIGGRRSPKERPKERRIDTVHDYRILVDGENTSLTVHYQWKWLGATGVWIYQVRSGGEPLLARDVDLKSRLDSEMGIGVLCQEGIVDNMVPREKTWNRWKS